ncbi:MAG TPA: hypothetical protein ENN41_09420 [Sediminispirochaeta sp.]|nr:hypothetical protein [Sediminispirochaeta sp.]
MGKKAFNFDRSLPLILLVLLLFPAGAAALEIESPEFMYELRWIGAEDPELPSAFAPVLSNTLSLRLPLRLGGSRFALVQGLNLGGLYYRYDQDGQRALPTDIERRELEAIVPLLETGLRWDPIKRERAGTYSVEIGAGFQLPLPFKNIEDDSGEIIPALYEEGAFFYPYSALQGAWRLHEKVFLLIRLSSHYPVFRLWDGRGLPFSDGLMLSLGVGGSIRK